MAFAVKGLASSGLALPTGRRTKQVARAGGEEIYIGFPKGDYDRTPGRKGRVIRDDPKKYPGREDMGPLKSVVGGWAGGEAGLWQLREEIQQELGKQNGTQGTTPLAPSSPLRAPAKNKWNAKQPARTGKDAIYVGFGKDELELKKSGAQGRVIYDEAYRYPGREDIGPFKSVVGGFAGGEAALKAFAESGELKLRKPGEPIPRKQFSPLGLAFLVIFVVSGASILITALLPLGDNPTDAVETAKAVTEVAKVVQANPQLLSGLLLFGGATAVLVALRTAVQAVRQQLAEKTEDLQKTAFTIAYFAAVAAIAYAILEAP